MKYLEELVSGDAFSLDNNYFVVTSDFKKNNQVILRNCINIKDGSYRWIVSNAMVDIAPLYTINTNGDITPIKEYKKYNETNN